MRLIVPYTSLIDDVEQALKNQWLEPEYKRMETQESYYNLLKEMWTKQESFINIEHDVVVGPHTIHDFVECHKPWCVNAYVVNGGMACALGCMKFGTELMRQLPYIMNNVDTRFFQQEQLIARLVKAGYEWHEHYPYVIHLNPGLEYLYDMVDLMKVKI